MTNEVKCNFPFFQAPNDIFKQDLKTVEIVTYLYLCRCGNHGGTAFPSYQNIADNCKIGKRTAIDAVKSLQEKGLLVKIIRPKDDKDNYTNIYEVAIPKSIQSATDAPPGAGGALPPGACPAPPGATDAPNKELSYKEPSFYKDKTIADTKTVSAHKLIIDHYHNKFLAKYGVKPFINGKTGKDVKGLLSNNIELHAQKVIILLDRYFDDNDDFIVKNRHSFSVFMSRINQLNTVGNTPKQSTSPQERGGCYKAIGGDNDPEFQAWLAMQEGR